MKKEDFKSNEKLIEAILEQDEWSRGDNDRLYFMVINTLYPNLYSYTIRDLFLDKTMKVPRYETVTRIRRKLQEENPNLKPSLPIQEFRKQAEKEFEEYGRQ